MGKISTILFDKKHLLDFFAVKNENKNLLSAGVRKFVYGSIVQAYMLEHIKKHKFKKIKNKSRFFSFSALVLLFYSLISCLNHQNIKTLILKYWSRILYWNIVWFSWNSLENNERNEISSSGRALLRIISSFWTY